MVEHSLDSQTVCRGYAKETIECMIHIVSLVLLRQGGEHCRKKTLKIQLEV
jgi:hypothetical protein